MASEAFDTERLGKYAKRARASFGNTEAWKEYEEKAKGRSAEAQKRIADGLMRIFCGLGRIKEKDPASPEARSLVQELKNYITEHYYTCTDEILQGLGKSYGSGGEFTANINSVAGEGAAEFAASAIEAYLKNS